MPPCYQNVKISREAKIGIMHLHSLRYIKTNTLHIYTTEINHHTPYSISQIGQRPTCSFFETIRCITILNIVIILFKANDLEMVFWKILEKIVEIPWFLKEKFWICNNFFFQNSDKIQGHFRENFPNFSWNSLMFFPWFFIHEKN